MRLTVLLSMVRISQICCIDYIERLPKKYLILLEFVKRDTPVLLIMCSPFVLKSKICFSFKLVARKLESMGYEHFTSNHSSFIIYILIFFLIYISIYIYLYGIYITRFVSSRPFTWPAMKYPSYNITFFLQMLPCKLNSPTFLLVLPVRSGSCTPHLDLLSNFIVSVSIFPVIGTCPNRWSLIIAFLNMGEFSSFTKAISLELR